MPVPTVAPTPNMVSWKVPIDRLRVAEAPWATGAPIAGRRRNICSVRLYEAATEGLLTGLGPSRLPDYARLAANPRGQRTLSHVRGINSTKPED